MQHIINILELVKEKINLKLTETAKLENTIYLRVWSPSLERTGAFYLVAAEEVVQKYNLCSPQFRSYFSLFLGRSPRIIPDNSSMLNEQLAKA